MNLNLLPHQQNHVVIEEGIPLIITKTILNTFTADKSMCTIIKIKPRPAQDSFGNVRLPSGLRLARI
ncbi:MAG: hypothetical protein U0T81_15325 [Saprospiraceae bacterium]